MGSVLVVIVTKGVELELQVSYRNRSGLSGQEALHGLVEALDLAAGPRCRTTNSLVGRGPQRAERKISYTLGALRLGKATDANTNREWSSIRLRISTSVSSASCQ